MIIMMNTIINPTISILPGIESGRIASLYLTFLYRKRCIDIQKYKIQSPAISSQIEKKQPDEQFSVKRKIIAKMIKISG
jgi:hypothetical protein